jgi:cytochrome c oxidase subunit 4
MAESNAVHKPSEGHAAEAHGGHADWKTYVIVGVILTVITAIEVAVFYIPALHGVMIPILLALSAVKFFIVVLWYMHLKFDSRIFWRVFFGPLFLAVLVVVGMILIFKVVPRFNA